MTPDDLRSAREALGLTGDKLARIAQSNARTVRRWEAGDREIPGPMRALVEALMSSRAVRRHFGVAVEGDSTPKNG